MKARIGGRRIRLDDLAGGQRSARRSVRLGTDHVVGPQEREGIDRCGGEPGIVVARRAQCARH
jgi:hypothetical protein